MEIVPIIEDASRLREDLLCNNRGTGIIARVVGLSQ
jgi:hypothetical protein